jgi:ribosomal protein L21E
MKNLITQFSVGDMVDGVYIEISVAVQAGAMHEIPRHETGYGDSHTQKAMLARAAEQLAQVRKEVILAAHVAFSKKENDQFAQHEKEIRDHATRAAAEVTAPIIIAKDARIAALEAQLAATRARRATRKAVRK